MSVFDTALTALLDDANLGVDVAYRQGGVAAPILLRAILSRPDLDAGFGETRVRAGSMRLHLRIADAPDLAAGDTFQVGSDVYVAFEAPERDTLRLSWNVDLEVGA